MCQALYCHTGYTLAKNKKKQKKVPLKDLIISLKGGKQKINKLNYIKC